MKNRQQDLGLAQAAVNLNLKLSDSDPLDVVTIVAESSMEESMLIGSPNAFLKLASELMRTVACFESEGEKESEFDDLENGGVIGLGEKMSDRIKNFFDEDAPVWPVCMCIAPSREVVDLIKKKLNHGGIS